MTLLELLVALAIAMSLLALLMGVIIQVMDLTNQGRGQAELQDGVTLALEQLTRELRAAVAVREEKGTLVATALSGEPVIYYLDRRSRTVVREDATGSHSVLPAPLEATAFRWQAEGFLLRLTLAARHRPGDNRRWQTFFATTAVVLRNEEP